MRASGGFVMADDEIWNFYYKFEQQAHYCEVESKRAVFYARNVPTILRGLTTESCGFDLQDPQFEEFDKLVQECPIEAAKMGVKDWNRWVQWAQLVHNRWIISKITDRGLMLRCRSFPDDDYDTYAINFSRGIQGVDEESYDVSFGEFDRFVFPCKTIFQKARFVVEAGFTNCFSASSLDFEEVIFEQHAIFVDVLSVGSLNFDRSVFNQNAIFEVTDFDNVTFYDALFSKFTIFNRSIVRQHIGFNDAVAKQLIHFDEIQFLGGAWFNGAYFNGGFTFAGSLFFAPARWDEAIIGGHANFSNCSFLSTANFRNARFNATVEFDGALFGKAPEKTTSSRELPSESKERLSSWKLDSDSMSIPDFNGAYFSTTPNLGYTTVAVPPSAKCNLPWWQRWSVDRHLAWKIRDVNSASKLRRLQELAVRGHYNLAEKRFFRAELLCRRGHEAKTWRENTMINAFELFSECGLSFWRPMIALGVLIAISAGFYYTQIDWPAGDGGGFELASYSFANSLPLIGYISNSYSVSVDVLFGGAVHVPGPVRVVAFLQNVVSAVFIFFGLLAIRNYFKLV